MANVAISPCWNLHHHDDNGNPAAGWLVHTYSSNTTIPKVAYSDPHGTVQHSNPIVLDARGEYPGSGLFLIASEAYTLVLSTPLGIPKKSADDVIASSAGTTGPQGIQGETGLQGAKGIQGLRGVAGSQGDQGDPGPQGNPGVQGIQGYPGSKGETGAKGDQGSYSETPVAFESYPNTILIATAWADPQPLPGTTLVNIGGAWDDSTGIFTCPVEGSYQFNFSADVYPSSLTARTIMALITHHDLINDTDQQYVAMASLAETSNSYTPNLVTSAVVALKVGDTVSIGIYPVYGYSPTDYLANISWNGHALFGAKGETGSQGLKGDQGIQGNTGIQGVTGIQGATGVLSTDRLIDTSGRPFSVKAYAESDGEGGYDRYAQVDWGVMQSFLNANGDIGGGIKIGGAPDNNHSFIFQNFASGQAATMNAIYAPRGVLNAADRESTLSLVRGNEPNQEIIDVYNNGYLGVSGQHQMGIRVMGKGTGSMRKFVFDYSDSAGAFYPVYEATNTTFDFKLRPTYLSDNLLIEDDLSGYAKLDCSNLPFTGEITATKDFNGEVAHTLANGSIGASAVVTLGFNAATAFVAKYGSGYSGSQLGIPLANAFKIKGDGKLILYAANSNIYNIVSDHLVSTIGYYGVYAGASEVLVYDRDGKLYYQGVDTDSRYLQPANSTLQLAYNNSTQPQIVTTAALGAFQIKAYTGGSLSTLLELLDDTGTSQLKVHDGGIIESPYVSFRSTQGVMFIYGTTNVLMSSSDGADDQVLGLNGGGSAGTGRGAGIYLRGNEVPTTGGSVAIRAGIGIEGDVVVDTNSTERFRITKAGLTTLASLTASTLLASGSSKELVSLATASYPSLTEIAYVKGVTSAIQTQLADKVSKSATSLQIINSSLQLQRPDATDGIYIGVTGDTYVRLLLRPGVIEFGPGGTTQRDVNLYRSAANFLKTDDNFISEVLTISRAVVTGASKELVSSATTATEIGYVSGVTSAIQTQLDANKIRYTVASRTASASTGSTDRVVVFSGSTAAQTETSPSAAALTNAQGRVVTYKNNATVSWTLTLPASNTLDGGTAAASYTMVPGTSMTILETGLNAWVTI